ncbi:hypothetical protein ACFL0S_11660, partial [Thermodesulfobacteriota bacterium]
SSGLSIIAIDSDGGGSAAAVQLLITLFYEAQIVGPVCPFSLAVEISIRHCKIPHEPVVQSNQT